MDKNTIEKSVKTKKANGNLNFKVSMPNTDRPIISCHETQNVLRANKATSRNKINSGNSIHKFSNRGYKTQKCYTGTVKC